MEPVRLYILFKYCHEVLKKMTLIRVALKLLPEFLFLVE